MALQIIVKSSEVKLVEMLNTVADPAGWQAVHFHLTDLLEEYKSEYQVKIAINLINDLLKDYEGGIFLLSDSSIVVLCNGLGRSLLGKLIFQLRYLYMDDPLAYSEDGKENPAFSTSYDLSHDWRNFSEWASRRMAFAARRMAPDAAKKAVPASGGVAEAPAVSGPLSIARLANIEADLYHADLSRVIHRQPVCAALPNAPVRRVFDELYIHIAHLRQMLKADVDFFSNRWLFKYVTQILDERMIALIRHNPSRYLESPISLNLNVETLLSSWFAEFDAMLKPSAKVSIIIEVPVVDVFADIMGFIVAREEVQKLGYRVCLDGLTAKSFANIDRSKLGFDLVKVQWNADAASDLKNAENQEFAAAVQRNGTNRVVLCRCDSKQAVEYGQALGISLFQGRYVDSLINPTSKVEN